MSDGGVYSNFRLETGRDGTVVTVTFSRPPVNAFTKECYEELSQIVKTADADESVHVLVLRSDQKHFSGGADVKQLQREAGDGAAWARRRTALRSAWQDLSSCKVPVVVALNGGAVGIGAAMAACGDVIVASEDAFISIPEINIGLVGGAQSLRRMLPAQKIRALALTGDQMPIQEALRFGGIEAVVPRNELHNTAGEYAIRIAQKGGPQVRKWKESFTLTESVGIGSGILIESYLTQELV